MVYVDHNVLLDGLLAVPLLDAVLDEPGEFISTDRVEDVEDPLLTQLVAILWVRQVEL